jgi:hypothetical protein
MYWQPMYVINYNQCQVTRLLGLKAGVVHMIREAFALFLMITI